MIFHRLGVPNTPRTGSTARSGGTARRKGGYLETPSTSRVKAEPASSPLTPGLTPGAHNGLGKPLVPGNLSLTNVLSMYRTSFNDRTNAGQLVEVLNDHLRIGEPPIAPYAESRVRLTANSDMKKLSYKTMAMKSSEASEILDERMDEFMLLIQAHHSLEDSAFGSAASQSTSEIVAVGRIASDSPEGRLNSSSIVLETSRRMGAGLRIPLRVDNLKGFQFFPGQIVALKGINASGENFTVSEILELPLLKAAASPPNALEDHLQRLRGGPDAMESDSDPAPLSILLGAGPYTADDNLDFEPLHAICSQAADSYADVLILTGPFLDIDHPLIATGDFDLPEEAMSEPDAVTMSTVFKYLVSPAFNQLVASNPRVTVLLIPSVKDTINKHASWPQEPIARKDLNLPKAVKLVGNPMTISLNEINVGITSQDILSELRLEEVIGGKPKDEAMLARLPKYLIEQRNYFPLYPPVDRQRLPKTGTEEGIPTGAMLDINYLKLGEILNVKPDMLIVPSALPPFAKV